MFKLVLSSIFPDTGDKNTPSTSTAIGLALHVVVSKEAEGEERKKTTSNGQN